MNKFGVPTDEQLTKINSLAKRTLSSDEVFVWPSKLAGDMIIPGHYIQLTKELLDVFAMDAKSGVSFLIDHSWKPDGFWGLGGRPRAAIPYGRTFDSSFAGGTVEGETISLNADTYMVRGIQVDGINTNDLIASVEAGILFDESIGFSYSKAVCSICGNSYNDHSKCEHIAGKTYEIEEDGVTKNKLCWIMASPPGNLWENSAVFDGAYPGAGMLSKAGDVMESESGTYQVVTELKDIDPAKSIIATYGKRSGLVTMLKKSDPQKQFAVGGIVPNLTDGDSIFALGNKIGVSREQVVNIANLVLKGGEKQMKTYTQEEVDALVKEAVEKEQMAQKEALEAAMAASAPLKVFLSQEQATEVLGKEHDADTILKLAKEGAQYRNELIEDAVEWGVRAQGNDFPVDAWKQMLSESGRTIEAIKDFKEGFKKQAQGSIPAGRITVPGAGKGQSVDSDLPDEAYKS